ncbi:alpha/beta fold hydrolase [Komagataeibacter swingsii]|uniref:Alpha/beta fold hydrolase n=1 Tax=Komagataeibacter swingsii TaxID=215220 RepID=A0A850P4J9_9PROT|nr:alpha/beta fold hydrolase [Komagataeibacter swingsii]NVN37689.1 alpha/beta fold hydrolase [Komagataeibacter swingsii]
MSARGRPMRLSMMIRRIAVLSNIRLSRLLYPALFVMLAACATHEAPPPPAPARHPGLARLVPADRTVTIAGAGAVPLRIWPARGAERAIILALHGFNDSRDAWEHPAPALNAAGMSVIAPDLPGFGQTAQRGGWVGTDALLHTASALLAIIGHEHPGIPVYVMGESMGGALAIVLASQPDTPPVAGYILLAPAVWDLDTGSRTTTHLIAALAPRWRLSGRELPVRVTAADDMLALARLYYDPLTLRDTSTLALSGLTDLMHRAARADARMHGRVLVIYGGHDQIIPAPAMARAWRRMPRETRHDYIPGGYHLLLRSRDASRVMADMTSWIASPDSFLPSGGDMAAAAWMADQKGRAAPLPILPGWMDWVAPQ